MSNDIILESLPLKVKHHIDISSSFSSSTCGVAVQYCVLQPYKEDNS